MIDYGYNQAEICWGDTTIGEPDIRRVLQGIVDVGGSRVRVAVQLGTVADLDRCVNLAFEYGLDPLLCIINNPSFGYNGSVASYGAMCKTLALRYGPSGTNQVLEYELFNEANNSLNAPGGANPANFTQYLKAGYTAIKSVHTSSTVIAGGTQPAPDVSIPFIGGTINPVEWYQGIYAAGGQNYMDALGFHFYADAPPTPALPQWKYLTDLRALMVAQGDSAKQIWVTEVGVGFPAPGVTDLVMARDWLKIMVQAVESYSWCGPFYIYNYRNCTNNTNDANSVYGIVDNSFNPKQPIYDYAKTIRGANTADTTKPSAPTGLIVSDVTSTSATFTWNPSTDNVGVTDYRLWLNAAKAADTAATSTLAEGLTPGTPYTAYITALDAAGNESLPSVTQPFTTAPPVGLQANYAYNFIGTGSTLPAVFVQLGLGFSVSGDVALPNAPTVDNEYWTVSPDVLDQQSPDHSSQISVASASANPYLASLALVRMKPDGSQFAGALIAGGGLSDACKIFTYANGVLTVQIAADAAPLQPGEKLLFTASGNVYTATRISALGVSTDIVPWVDVKGEYPGSANRRAGIGWWHRRVNSINYVPPGITGLWKATDLYSVSPPSGGGSGGADAWMLAITHQKDWGRVIATGLWESAL